MHRTQSSFRTAQIPGLLGLIVLAGWALPAGSADTPWVDPRTMPIPDLHPIQKIEPQRVELKNGMVVFFLEDHDFPVADVRALIRVGDIYDPADKIGLATLTGTVMRTGGSTRTPGDELDETLESMGASVEIGIGDTQGSAGISALSQNLEVTLRVLGELLQTPAFPEDKLDLAKKQMKTGIASRNDEPLDIAIRELSSLVYGMGHPYARYPEYATLDAITREDLVAFHRTYFHPDRMILTVYGDFQTKQVKKLLEEIFGSWPRSTRPLPPDPVVKPTEVSGNFLAEKTDMTNSFMVLGQEGMRQDHADYPAMAVYHEFMGGGFGSRLFNEIRTKRGLAYASGSFAGAQLHHPGPQGFYVMTQSDSTLATLGYLREEIRKSLDSPPTTEELQRAKDSILNSLVFSLSSKGSVLNRMAAYEFYGYPMDFLTRYQKAVAEMTAEEVQAAARRNVRYDGLATLVVCDKAAVGSQLAGLGAVTELDITIPEPASAAGPRPPATPADLARGQELLDAALAAAGGTKLAGLADMTLVESGTFSVQGMEIQLSVNTVRKLPDCEKAEQKLPMGTMVQAVCGDEAWMDAMQGPQAMPPDMRADLETERRRDLWNVLSNHAGLELQALPGETEVDGRPARAIFVKHEDIKEWTVFVDESNGRIVRMDYRDKSMDGRPVLTQVLYQDYREVEGITWPHRRVILQDDEPLATLEVTEIRFNTGVSEDQFRKPS